MNPQEMVATRLGRARMLVLAFGILLVLLSAGQLDTSSDVLPLSVAALIAEIGILLGTAWRQQHVTILEAPATAVLAVLVGISLHNPLASTWICIGVIMTQTLYDGRLSAWLRLISFVGVLPLSTALSASPVGRQLEWSSPASLTPVALVPLFLSLMIMLKGALESQERSLAREHFLGTTSGRLLAARSPEMVNKVLGPTIAAMCDFVPGLTVVMVHRGTRRGPAKVVRVAGARGRSTPTEIPPQMLTPLDPIRGHVLGELIGGSTALPTLGLPKQRIWYGLPMGLPKEVEEAMGLDTVLWGVPMNFGERFLGISGPTSAETVELLRISTRHGRLAYEAAVERLELLERAEHDSATGLPDRESLMRQLTQLSDVDGVGCEIVLIGFGGFRDVIRGHGLDAWSRLIRQFGERITELQSSFCPGSFSARLADDMIALVLPGRPGSTAGAVALLSERLAEPMLLDGTPIGVPTAFGTAGPAGGSSSVELVDAAVRRLLASSVPTSAH